MLNCKPFHFWILILHLPKKYTTDARLTSGALLQIKFIYKTIKQNKKHIRHKHNTTYRDPPLSCTTEDQSRRLQILAHTGIFLLEPQLEESQLSNQSQTFDASILEFDFITFSDTILFSYVFASEEYKEFVNANFNDAFGFFISGPGISGPFSNNSMNIAINGNLTIQKR